MRHLPHHPSTRRPTHRRRSRLRRLPVHWTQPRDERGDVPGWVLITVMTAGLVAGLWAIAGSQLGAMLRSALSSVSG